MNGSTVELPPTPSVGRRITSFARTHGWWIGASLAVGAVVGTFVGYVVPVVAYAAANDLGVWLALDRRFSPTGRRAWLAWTAIVLLPVGLIAYVMSNTGELGPADAASFGSSDESVRNDSARSASAGMAGPGHRGTAPH